jgi:hypothetical protein
MDSGRAGSLIPKIINDAPLVLAPHPFRGSDFFICGLTWAYSIEVGHRDLPYAVKME